MRQTTALWTCVALGCVPGPALAQNLPPPRTLPPASSSLHAELRAPARSAGSAKAPSSAPVLFPQIPFPPPAPPVVDPRSGAWEQHRSLGVCGYDCPPAFVCVGRRRNPEPLRRLCECLHGLLEHLPGGPSAPAGCAPGLPEE
jgi:hypothetical protein